VLPYNTFGSLIEGNINPKTIWSIPQTIGRNNLIFSK